MKSSSKVKLIAGLVAGLGALSLAAPVSATLTLPVPTQCSVASPILTGPSRAAHSSSPRNAITVPLCIDVTGICVTVQATPAGPSRVAHRVAGTACVPLDPVCAFTVEVPPYTPPTTSTAPGGASRVAHSPSLPAQYATIDIPLACQNALTASLALPPTGGKSTPTALIATLFVLAGGGMVVGTRRLARR